MTLLLPLLLLTSFWSGAETDPPVPFELSINVSLVVLHPTVENHKGAFVSNLREQDFEVYENGVRQALKVFRHEDVPVTVGLVVDHSESMRNKLTDVVEAARSFVRLSSTADQMFVVNFNDHVTLGLLAGTSLTNRADQLTLAISETQPEGMTALYDAVFEGLEVLRAGTTEKKVLIVVSDGGDNASKHHLAEVLTLAEESSALIYTIGIFDEDDPDRNPEVLRHLARATGGEAFFPKQTSDVVKTCEGIARDIRNQYTIGYASSDRTQNGALRTIRVVAHAPGEGKLSVRARSGYIARPQPGAPELRAQ